MDCTFGVCQQAHAHMNGKVDGCQKFQPRWEGHEDCKICGCHQNFHERFVPAVTRIVYKKCNKIHDFKFQSSVDGCQEFTPAGKKGTSAAINCAVCGCHKGFHGYEIKEQVTTSLASAS